MGKKSTMSAVEMERRTIIDQREQPTMEVNFNKRNHKYHELIQE